MDRQTDRQTDRHTKSCTDATDHHTHAVVETCKSLKERSHHHLITSDVTSFCLNRVRCHRSQPWRTASLHGARDPVRRDCDRSQLTRSSDEMRSYQMRWDAVSDMNAPLQKECAKQGIRRQQTSPPVRNSQW